MSTSIDKFAEQFKELKPFERLRVLVELTRSVELTYQHFLLQLFQVNILMDNNAMFEHTVDDANSPDIVNCLLINPEKILSTLQLFLPLIVMKTMNEKLINAYRDVFLYLDKHIHLIQYTDFENQIYNPVQQIYFFIHNNIHFKKFLSAVPNLAYILAKKSIFMDEQHHHRVNQKFSLENSNSTSNNQQLTRHEIGDSGVDLTEPTISNSTQIFLSQNQQQIFFEQNSLSTINIQRQHSTIGKTTSAPVTLKAPVRVQLHGALSAPTSSSSSNNYRQNFVSTQYKKYQSTLAKSDEEEEDESQNQLQDLASNKSLMANENTIPLTSFYSLGYGTMKNNSNSENISPYLGVDQNSSTDRNACPQLKPGMKEVRTWLKHLRLHKYEETFFPLSYDEMMNLTDEQLKSCNITDGARKKILSNIEKLKERTNILKQCISGLDNGQVDLLEIIRKLEEITYTPIRSKQLEIENNSNEDLPRLIIELLEKILKQVITSSSSDLCWKLLSLIDRCYRMEVFNEEQVLLLLNWRRRLTQLSKTLKEHQPTPLVPSHSFQSRRSFKSSAKSTKNSYPVSLTKFNSEPQHNNTLFENYRRSNKSPSLICPTHEEPTNNYSTNNTNGAYLANHRHQTLTRKQSIDPHSESKSMVRPGLCQTYSDPNRMRPMPYPSIQQPRLTLTVPSIRKSHSENEQYETNTSMDTFCQQITNKAINDDVQQSITNDNIDGLDIQMVDQSAANCPDTDK